MKTGILITAFLVIPITGLKCYKNQGGRISTEEIDCGPRVQHCFKRIESNGTIHYKCGTANPCAVENPDLGYKGKTYHCCTGDLCNGAAKDGISVVSVFITTAFLSHLIHLFP